MEENPVIPAADRNRAWVAPESDAATPAPSPSGGLVTGAALSTRVAAAGRRPPASVPVPVPLRPFTAGDILDGGIAVLKNGPRPVFTVVAALVIPVQVVTAYIERKVLADTDAVEQFEMALDTGTVTVGSSGPAAAWSFVASSALLVLVAAGVARLVSAWYVEASPTTGQVLKAVARSAPALLTAWFLVHLLELGGGVLFVAPGVIMMTGFLVTAPAIAVERIGPIAGMRRSWKLVMKGRFWPTLGIALLIAAVASVLSFSLSALSLLFSGFSWSWIPDAVFRSGAALVTTSFVAAATTLAYLDLRIRVEGLDIELAAAEALPADAA